MPIFVFVFVVAAAHIVLTRTPFGRQIYAVGNDIDAAKKAGIDTRRIIFSVYVISGVCAALGGLMLISLIGRLNQTFGVGKEFEVITAAVLGGASLFGGVGSAFGAVVGAVLVQMVQAGMVFIQVNLYMQPMVLAAIIFLAVFFDSLRERRVLRLKRRSIRIEAAAEPSSHDGDRTGLRPGPGNCRGREGRPGLDCLARSHRERHRPPCPKADTRSAIDEWPTSRPRAPGRPSARCRPCRRSSVRGFPARSCG